VANLVVDTTEQTLPPGCPPELSMAIQNGETWYKVNPEWQLNIPFIAMVMAAYCSLPIANYMLRNNQERGQTQLVQTSHLTVVALLAYKAVCKNKANPRQNHTINILQLNTRLAGLLLLGVLLNNCTRAMISTLFLDWLIDGPFLLAFIKCTLAIVSTLFLGWLVGGLFLLVG
jgi:hypothetical protein